MTIESFERVSDSYSNASPISRCWGKPGTGAVPPGCARRYDPTCSPRVKTVESHRKHVMDKLDLRSIAELTKYALRERLTSLDY